MFCVLSFVNCILNCLLRITALFVVVTGCHRKFIIDVTSTSMRDFLFKLFKFCGTQHIDTATS